jgi:hypothetical protein
VAGEVAGDPAQVLAQDSHDLDQGWDHGDKGDGVGETSGKESQG